MCCLVLRADEVKGRALGFRLEQFFKLVQVQVLAEVDEKENAVASTTRGALTALPEASAPLWITEG